MVQWPGARPLAAMTPALPSPAKRRLNFDNDGYEGEDGRAGKALKAGPGEEFGQQAIIKPDPS
jgi:hypothetical protein